MSSLADKGDLDTNLAVDRRDHAKGQVLFLQHRALLYVHLAIAEQVLIATAITFEGVRDSAEGTHRLPQGHTVAGFEKQAFAVERASVGGASQVGRTEPQALFVSEANYFDGVREPLASVVQLLDARDRHHNAEDTVVLARLPYGVEVGTEDERSVAKAFVAVYEVADLVRPRGHPGRAHPAGNDVVYLATLR